MSTQELGDTLELENYHNTVNEWPNYMANQRSQTIMSMQKLGNTLKLENYYNTVFSGQITWPAKGVTVVSMQKLGDTLEA